MKKFNWQIWAAFLLSLFAFLSYPLLFVRFPVTRDFPWANLLLFVAAVAFMLFGLRRAFASDRAHPLRSKISGGILATLSLAILVGFVLTVPVLAESTAPVTAPKDHLLFVGTDLSVKQNGEFHHVVGATRNTLKIEKHRRMADVRLGDGTSIRINKEVKLSNLSASISNLHRECEDRESARAALNNGAPVEGRVKVTLAQLAN